MLKKLRLTLALFFRGLFRSTEKVNDIAEVLRPKSENVTQKDDFTFTNNLLSKLNLFEEPKVTSSNLDAEGDADSIPDNEKDFERRFPDKYEMPWDESPLPENVEDFCDIDDLKDQVKPQEQHYTIGLWSTPDLPIENTDTCTSTPE